MLAQGLTRDATQGLLWAVLITSQLSLTSGGSDQMFKHHRYLCGVSNVISPSLSTTYYKHCEVSAQQYCTADSSKQH